MKAGAQAPERFEITIANAAGDPDPLDLSTVTAATLRVRNPRGVERVWATTTTVQTSTTLTLRHVFALEDVDIVGDYRVNVDLAVPGGFRRTGSTSLRVVA